MSDRLIIPGAARVAAGAFVAGAGLVGGVWVLTSRTPMPPPPHPQTSVLWPSDEPPTTTSPTSTVPLTPIEKPEAKPAPVIEQPAVPVETAPTDGDVLSGGPSILPKEPEATEPDPLDGYDGPLVMPINSRPGATTPTETKEPAPADTPKPSDSPGSAVQLIHINTATLAELQLLPGIGPVLAQRILDDRAANGRFGSVNDLQRVKGIGEKTAAKIAPLITFD